MTVIRKNFTFDSEEDGDIVNFFESIPARQDSKYIRMAIRMLIQEMVEKEEISSSRTSVFEKNKQHKETKKKEEKDEDGFTDLEDDILNLGK